MNLTPMHLRNISTLFVLLATGLFPLTSRAQKPVSQYQIMRNEVDRREYVRVGPGSFEMGCVTGDNACFFLERPRHTVRITRAFWIGQTEVTVGAYERFTEATGRTMPDEHFFNRGWMQLDQPMVNVTWFEAVEYCRWVGGRLPTEAEWEYAARGGTSGQIYLWGNDPNPPPGRTEEFPFKAPWKWLKPTSVGRFPRNAFGLADMIGNAEEWTADLFDPLYFRVSPRIDPTGPSAQGEGWVPRAVRGGSWRSRSSELMRLSFRYGAEAGSRSNSRGFRCVLDKTASP